MDPLPSGASDLQAGEVSVLHSVLVDLLPRLRQSAVARPTPESVKEAVRREACQHLQSVSPVQRWHLEPEQNLREALDPED